MMKSKKDKRQKVRFKIRKRIVGSQEQPRLAVFRSNNEIYAQLIDDSNGKTIVTSSSRDKNIIKAKANKTELASLVGKDIAEKAIKKGVKQASFDRSGYLYHGRVKSLADGAREVGLKF